MTDTTTTVDLYHDSIDPQDVHAPYSFIFNNAFERDNAQVLQKDIGKLARQLDNHTVWVLIDTIPTWIRLLMEGDSATPIGRAGGHLAEFYPNPIVLPDSHAHTPGITIPEYPKTLPPSGLVTGPDLEGVYPAPVLKPTGVVPGEYINPTLRIDSKGRIVQAVSGLPGEVNVGLNIGGGVPLYKRKDNVTLLFRTITTPATSGLEVALREDTVNVDSPGLAKLSGAVFTGTVEAPTVVVKERLQVDGVLVQTLKSKGSGTHWSPLAQDGSRQMREFVGPGRVGTIIGSQSGMVFTFYLNLAGDYPIAFDSEYHFGSGEARTPRIGMNILEVYIVSPILYDAKLRVS